MDGFCLVISPLISLMQDQVERLRSLGIMAECIHAGMHGLDVKRILENMVHGPYKLLYVSPERLQTELFKEYLPAFDISFIAVDEAHCISQWGHDFRPDYLKIAAVRNVFENIPVLALTASATPDVEKDIAVQLKLRNPAIIRQSFERTNIFYEVAYSENKNNDVLRLLQQQRGCSIVYCRSRKQTEFLAHYLIQHGFSAVAYHAGMAKDKREEHQLAWMQDKATVMVATTAFGMGIDKPNVRSVIHYDVPEHLEAYYQESGRGGRDGKEAVSLVVYNQANIRFLKESIEQRFPPETYLRKLYQSVTEYLQVPISAEPDRYYDFELADFCKKFKLDAVAASHGLRLLEQEGLWTLTSAVFRPATLMFTTDRQELDELTGMYPELATVTTALLRLYGSVMRYPTPFRLAVIAKQIKCRQDQVEHMLLKLQEMGILEYYRPTDGPQLFFHHYRVDSRHLLIDLKRIARLRKQCEARTNAMIQYLQNTQYCRNIGLLQYFGEHRSEDCGHCDICRSKAYSKTNNKTARQEILHKVEQQGIPIHLQQILAAFPAAIREDLATLIRGMVDDGVLKLHENGFVSLS